MIVSTVIECGSAEIVVFADVRGGSRATREEPGSGPWINRITAVTREEPCTRPRCYTVGSESPTARRKHTHPVAVDAAALEAVLGPAAWSAVEDALIEAAMDWVDERDPDETRDR